MTSIGDSSSHAAFSGLYTWVPLMMTVWAGRLTPHASVAVDTSTCTWPSANRSSTRVLSDRAMPAWWMAKPWGSRSRSSALLQVAASSFSTSRDAESSRTNRSSAPELSAASRMKRAVLAVSLRECTNTSVWCLPAPSSTFS